MQYRDSHQGGHELLHLPTNKIIIRRNITPMPITKAIVNTVETIAKNEGMPSGLKIVSKTDNILYDSAWIAGVDDQMNNHNATNYNNDQDQDQDYMHPDDIEGMGNAKHQTILPNTNNETVEPETNKVQEDHEYEDDDEEEIVFEEEDEEEEEEEKEDEEEEVQTEDDDDPEDDGVLRTRSG